MNAQDRLQGTYTITVRVTNTESKQICIIGPRPKEA